MAIRKLLLPLTGTAAGEAALSTALMTARLWNAHVSALHVRVDSRDVAPLAGEGLSGAMIEEMMSATEKESSDRAHAVRAMFERFAGEHEVIIAGCAARLRLCHGQLRRGNRAGGGSGGAACAPRGFDGGAASGRGRGRLLLRRAPRRAVRFRPTRPDRAADRAGYDRHAHLRRLERHRRIGRVGLGGAALDAAGRRGSHSVGRGISAAGAGRARSRRLSRVARRECRDGHVPPMGNAWAAGCSRRRREFGATFWRWAPIRIPGCAS